MKKLFLKTILLFIISALTFYFTGCDNADSQAQNVIQTKPVEETTVAVEKPVSSDVRNLHNFDYENGNDFAGAWKISDGEGSQYESFVYLFNGYDESSIIVGTQGYLGKYELGTEKTQDGSEIKTMTTQLMFGLNGTYKYVVSEDKMKIELTHIENNTSTTLERMDNFDFIPIPESNPKIDEAIVGAWRSESGEYVYFDKNGIMYQNQYGAMFTYFTYSVSDSIITAKYTMDKETTDIYEYKLDGDKLILNDYEYEKIDISELI